MSNKKEKKQNYLPPSTKPRAIVFELTNSQKREREKQKVRAATTRFSGRYAESLSRI